MQKTFFVETSDISVKGVSENKALKIAGYANTIDKDRGGDVVSVEAWSKGIENFRNNPILLYQHDHSKPIGRVTSITVDKKGIFVEASISEAAEQQHSVKTLIKDGVLRSFSVGFKVLDAIYDKAKDTFIIKALELLEISVVSVPMNQNSLFSIRKSFEEDTAYEEFKSKFAEVTTEEEVTTADTAEPVEAKTTEEEVVKAVTEESIEEEISSAEITDSKEPIEIEKPIPFINLLGMDTTIITQERYVQIDGDRYKTVKIATSDVPVFTFTKCDISGTPLDETINVSAAGITILNYWDADSEYDLRIIPNFSLDLDDETNEKIKKEFSELVNCTEFDLWSLKSKVEDNKDLQRILNKTINLLATDKISWNSSHFHLAATIVEAIKQLKTMPHSYHRDQLLNVYGHNIQPTHEENKQMSTENVGEPILINNSNSASTEPKVEVKTATVSEPKVMELVAKTGEAIVRADAAADRAEDTRSSVDRALLDEVAELRGQMKAYKEQIAAATTSKMHYAENTRKEQFTPSDMTNAVLLAKALRVSNFDTKLGQRMKAVITDNHLNENFSTNTYEELRQKLIIAPMFKRLEVNVKDFRVPVADEDTNDFVAQFPSGSFAAGANDTVTVPTSRQAQIASVTLSPKKFMVATHLAKDEEEDTLIPLIDFLRESATNRLSRGIDKAILRGDGSLSAFTTSSTLTPAATYPSVIKGVVELAAAVGGLVTKTGSTIDKADPTEIAAARLKLGKYGLTMGQNLAYITSVEGYNNLVTFQDFQTVDKFGSLATYLTGSVGAIYGIPIYVTEFMDAASAADSNLGVLVYKPGFLIGERRAMEVESEYLPQQQVTAMYMSTRIDFKALTTVADAALSTRYSFAGLITTAS